MKNKLKYLQRIENYKIQANIYAREQNRTCRNKKQLKHSNGDLITY